MLDKLDERLMLSKQRLRSKQKLESMLRQARKPPNRSVRSARLCKVCSQQRKPTWTSSKG